MKKIICASLFFCFLYSFLFSSLYAQDTLSVPDNTVSIDEFRVERLLWMEKDMIIAIVDTVDTTGSDHFVASFNIDNPESSLRIISKLSDAYTFSTIQFTMKDRSVGFFNHNIQCYQ